MRGDWITFGIGLAMMAAALAGCQSVPPPTSTQSTLWLPLPETMARVEYIDFHNDGPEIAVLMPQPPRKLRGIGHVMAGETARVTWEAGAYKAEILP